MVRSWCYCWCYCLWSKHQHQHQPYISHISVIFQSYISHISVIYQSYQSSLVLAMRIFLLLRMEMRINAPRCGLQICGYYADMRMIFIFLHSEV